MSERRKLWAVVSDLENDLADVERWGLVLTSMGTSQDVHTEAAFVVGQTLVGLGRRLRNGFEVALERAKEADAKQCA